MIAFGILIAVVTVIGVGRTVHSVVTDGYGRVPTDTHRTMFDLR